MTVSKEEILARLHQLPSMSAVIQEIMDSFNNENLDSSVLAEMIERDHGLSAKVLRVANSSFYGLPRQIASIRDGVVVMGLDAVRSLVLSAGFVQTFPPVPGGAFDRAEFWKHSFRVAGYAKALEQSLRLEPKMAFTAAMFHEIGQLVLDVCIPQQFDQVLQHQKSSRLSLLEIEQQEFGFDHAEIGAEMARHWNFPMEIEHSIRYWADPDHLPFRALNAMVYAAVQLEKGLFGEDFIRLLPEVICKNLNMSWDCLEAYLPDSDELNAGAELLLTQ